MPAANDLLHIWNRCHACGVQPIVGTRFMCLSCPAGADNDLCEACYRGFQQGRVKHPAPEAREAPPGRHIFHEFAGVERTHFEPWLAAPSAAAVAAPRVPDRFVVRPEFQAGRESFFGSYGFVVAAEDGGQPLVMTALHVLDELAKFKRVDCYDTNAAYTGQELPAQVTGVKLYDPYAANWVLAQIGAARDMLTLRAARVGTTEPYCQDDVAAFRVAPPSSLHPVRLAAAAPAVGDPVWLAVNPGRGAAERTCEAVAVEVTEKTFIFRFSPSAKFPPYTSGAPLLNRAGEIVGLNVSAGIFEGSLFGHAAHVGNIRRHLGWPARQ
jgi:hypothetical protein